MLTIAFGIILVPVILFVIYMLAVFGMLIFLDIKRRVLLKKGYHYYKCEKLGSMGGIYTDYIWAKEAPIKGKWYDFVEEIY